MGNSASKTTRTLNKTVQQNPTSLNSLKKQIKNDHLKNSLNKNSPKVNKHHQIFTERPPNELEQMGDAPTDDISAGKNSLFEKAVSMGVVNIKDSKVNENFNPNHESIQVLKNRANIEKQYEGLFIPKDADQPNIPDRFLTEEERKNVHNPELMKKKLEKTGTNSFGLFDSKTLSDFIVDYRVFGKEKLDTNAKENDVNDENLKKFKQFIDEGILDLPTNKVTLQESIDPESKQVKQKLVIVKDDWVSDIKQDIEREKNNNLDYKSTSKKDKEVFEQFKILENLVSKSQIRKNPAEGDSEQENNEPVMKRPVKKLAKEVKKML